MNVQGAYVNRVLANLRHDLDFLADVGAINEQAKKEIQDRLPEKFTQPEQRKQDVQQAPAQQQQPQQPQHARTNGDQQEAAPPQQAQPVPSPAMNPAQMRPANAMQAPALGMVEAMYEFSSTDPGDLSIHPGERIQITEYCNQDWLRGRNGYGKEGIFPRSYCRMLGPPPAGPPAGPHFQGPAPPYNGGYPGEKQEYNPPLQHAATAPSEAPAQQQQQPHHRFGPAATKIGGKLGNSFLFGAGATMGADVVNAIL